MSTPTSTAAMSASSTSAVPSATPTHHHQGWWTAGKIAGIAVGVAVFLLLLLGCCIFALIRSRKAKKQKQPHHEDTLPVYEKPRAEPVRQEPVQQQQQQTYQAPAPAREQAPSYGGAIGHAHGHEQADTHMHNESWHPSQVAKQQGGTWKEPHALANQAMTQTESYRNGANQAEPYRNGATQAETFRNGATQAETLRSGANQAETFRNGATTQAETFRR